MFEKEALLKDIWQVIECYICLSQANFNQSDQRII